jgi:hypothetical protein
VVLVAEQGEMRPSTTSAGASPIASTDPVWTPVTWRAIRDAFFVVLPLWVASRALGYLGLLAAQAGWGTPTMAGPDTYDVWDVGWFISIARDGYSDFDENPARVGAAAFMPLLPGLMRYGRVLFGWSELGAGAVITSVSALIAGVALYLLVRMGVVRGRRGSHEAGMLAVCVLLLSPLGLPLFVPYTESLLLALAIPAWIAARQQMWWLAGILASLAVLARITGLSVAFGIGVMWLISRWPAEALPTGRKWAVWLRKLLSWQAVWVVLPLVAYIGWTVRLSQLTGRWNATTFAQETVWGRRVVLPWEGFFGTIDAFDGGLGYVMKREMVATFVVLAVVIVLAVRRMWPEFAYVGSACLILMCSSVWGSSIRALTALFPFTMLFGLALATLWRRQAGRGWVLVLVCAGATGLFWCELLFANGVFVI